MSPSGGTPQWEPTVMGPSDTDTLYIWPAYRPKLPDGFIGIFHWHNPSGRTMALGLTQPLIEMSTRNILWGVKAAGAYGWQPYHLHVPIVLKSGSLNLLEPSGPVMGLFYLFFTDQTSVYMGHRTRLPLFPLSGDGDKRSVRSSEISSHIWMASASVV